MTDIKQRLEVMIKTQENKVSVAKEKYLNEKRHLKTLENQLEGLYQLKLIEDGEK